MTTPLIHTGLASGRWQQLSICEQLGNIGSDIARALRAREQGSKEREDAALDRALELFDLTISDPKNHGPRLRELCRAREVVCDFFFGENEYGSTPDSLDRYFLTFALAARLDK